jgi:hypothetical protein
MHWRTDYLILGDLAGVARLSAHSQGDRFTAPLNFQGPDLVGSVFLGGREAGGKRVALKPLAGRVRLHRD